MKQDELPIELECFLIRYGFFENTKSKGKNTPVFIAEPVEEYKAWTPSYPGEDPPF